MIRSFSFPALAAASAGALAIAAPAGAAPSFDLAPVSASAASGVADSWQHSRNRARYNDGYGYRGSRQAYYGEPVYRNTRVWRGRDGRVYCRKRNGTTGLIVGGAVGALIGRQLDGGYDRSAGTIIGAAAGALLGREVSRGSSRCR